MRRLSVLFAVLVALVARAAAAQGGWYLMIPWSSPPTGSVANWRQSSAHDSAAECEESRARLAEMILGVMRARTERMREIAEGGSGDVGRDPRNIGVPQADFDQYLSLREANRKDDEELVRLLAAVCIASNDPRLAPGR